MTVLEVSGLWTETGQPVEGTSTEQFPDPLLTPFSRDTQLE
ncbi:hypothetical protein [Streptomyces sp. NPDC012825]